MSFSVGIVGIPNVGKSTLFKALTKKKVDIASYPFTTINPNVGIVTVPDKRLAKIAEVIKPEKITPTIIEFVDIAGLVKEAHKGEGLGNQFLSQIRSCDAILEVVRTFKADNIEHVEKEINPQRDIEIIKTELLMKDLEMAENLLKKMERDIKTKEKRVLQKWELIKKIYQNLSQGKLISALSLSKEEKKDLKEFQFLTLKPIVYVLNVGQETEEDNRKKFENLFPNLLVLNLKLEEEFSELLPEEKEELGITSQLNFLEESQRNPLLENQISQKFLSGVDQLILACYNVLGLITFYTVAGGKETRAWTLKEGETVLEAAKCVHSDFFDKFIRAEEISWQELIRTGAWSKAREKGKIRTVGREYIVQDGDVIEFKI